MDTRQFEKELRQLLGKDYKSFVSAGFYVELPNDYMVEILSRRSMNLWEHWDFKDGGPHIIERYENLDGLEPEEAFSKIQEWKEEYKNANRE